MNPIPTGRVVRNADGTCDMVLTRTFDAEIDDVWASVTEPERTARWFGAWRGQAGPGRTIELQMGFEEGTPWFEARIDECRPPHQLAVSTVDEAGEWHLELNLVESAGITTLELVQHGVDPAMVENTGPGWEFYLDQLVAARAETPLPTFDGYYPAQAGYYQAAISAAQQPAVDSTAG